MKPVTATPKMGFGQAVESGLRKWLDFKGRARRSEYCWCALCASIYQSLGACLDGFFQWRIWDIEVFSTVFSIALFIPMTALLTRRLHDCGMSGWWLVALYVLLIITKVLSIAKMENFIIIAEFLLIPLILIIFVATFADGEKCENKYGPSPKYRHQS